MENKSKRFTLHCNCGCGDAITFVNDYGLLYVNPLMSYFDALQGNQYLRTKKVAEVNGCVFDIVVEKQNLEDLKTFLSNCKFEKKEKACFDLKFNIDKLYEKTYSFELHLPKKMEEYDRKEFYRLFDISLNEKEVKALISLIEKAYKKKEIISNIKEAQ